jgi:hypothetical protein
MLIFASLPNFCGELADRKGLKLGQSSPVIPLSNKILTAKMIFSLKENFGTKLMECFYHSKRYVYLYDRVLATNLTASGLPASITVSNECPRLNDKVSNGWLKGKVKK